MVKNVYHFFSPNLFTLNIYIPNFVYVPICEDGIFAEKKMGFQIWGSWRRGDTKNQNRHTVDGF